jgi:serine/threonine protein kinase
VFEIFELKDPSKKKYKIGKKYVVKIVNKKEKTNSMLSDSTIDFILALDHPNITKIYDILDEKENLYIVEEFCEFSDLFSYMSKNKKLAMNESFIKKIVYQMCSALNYLHENNIIHKNLKPENILISQENPIHIKLSDFAASGQYVKNKEYNDIIGLPIYYSPEYINGHCDEKGDIWSLGIITYNLLYMRYPFDGQDFEILYEVTFINQ